MMSLWSLGCSSRPLGCPPAELVLHLPGYILAPVSGSTYGTLREVHVAARFSVFRARRADGTDVVIKQDRSGRPELGGLERLHHEYEILRTLEAAGT